MGGTVQNTELNNELEDVIMSKIAVVFVFFTFFFSSWNSIVSYALQLLFDFVITVAEFYQRSQSVGRWPNATSFGNTLGF